MSFILQPWQLLLMILASWVHREQQKVIEFYRTQVEAPMAAQGKKRLLLTDEVRLTDGDLKCKERLGGLLKYYYRNAA